MFALRSFFALVPWVILLSPRAQCQQVPITSLTRPDRVCERGFTKVVGIKELRDGRAILVDEIEKLVLILDADLAGGEPIGRLGPGPGEYQVPSRLFSLAGDSSAVLDAPNRRLLVLTPAGETGGVLSFLAGFGRPTASDVRGRFYNSRHGAIRRWDPSSSVVDTVASYPVSENPKAQVIAGFTVISPEDLDPFPAQGVWAVAPDGRVAILHPDPYHVELVNTNGAHRQGPVVQVDRIRVTEEHKEQWREEKRRPTTLGHSLADPEGWPRYLPPFVRGAATFGPDYHLWVQRTTEVGQPPVFDLFDSDGALFQKVTLPPGRELVGFGRGTVYTVVRDVFDLEYLERYSFDSGR